MRDLSLLAPLARFVSDVGKILIKDDQLDLAFPTRAHSGFAHHWKWGFPLFILGNTGAGLLELLDIIQKTEYKTSDTPQSFLKRVIQIHQNSYNPAQEAEEERLNMLMEYFNNLKGVNSKERFEENYEQFMHRNIPKNVIYGGKINLSSQKQKKSSKNLDPPRVYPPSASTDIRLYKTNT